MATTFGTRPEDTVADSRGNVQPGVVIQLYPTKTDATNKTALIASPITDAKGLYAYSDPLSRTGLWARDPAGNIWPINAEEVASSVDGKADKTYVDAQDALNLTISGADAKVGTLVSTGGSSTQTALDGRFNTKTVADARFARAWQPSTAYTAGQVVVSPSGDVVSANSTFTSGPTFSSANWTSVLTQAGTQSVAALDGRYPRSSGLSVDASNASGVDATGVTECHAAIQAVLDANAATAFQPNNTVRLKGTFNISSTLFVKGNLDASAAIFNYSGSGVAVQIGTSALGNVSRWNVLLGDINCTTKPAGASWVAGSVGLQLSNASRSNITYHTIANFETGLLMVGDGTYGSGGTAYNIFGCGTLDNNLVNQSLQLVAGSVTPFVNENKFYGGGWSHSDGVYPQTGMRHILIGTAGGGSLNNNKWDGCSLEGGREEYILDVYGNDNTWVGCRWETSGHNPPTRWRATAARNLIIGGYQSNELQTGMVIDSGAVANNVIGTNSWDITTTSDGGITLAAFSGGTTSPLTVMRPDWRRLGDTTAANYIVKLASSGMLRFKSSSDTSDRFAADYVNRKLVLGAGIDTSASGIYWGTGTPEAAITAPQGATYYNYGAGTTGFGQYVKGTGTGNTGWHAVGFQPFATASRPTASLAGIGGCYYDTTLSKPGFSDGATWRDAMGTAI